MEALIKNIINELARCGYSNQILINNVQLILFYLIGSGDIESYIFDNQSKIFKGLFKTLITSKPIKIGNYKNEDNNIHFFHSVITDTERIIKNLSTKTFDDKDKSFLEKSLSLLPIYYSSLENMYSEFVFEYKRRRRKKLNYPIEAYEYKR